mmetsp:Transcript_17282/g.43008  ORF Transcript_17282/g.43008 Transcript_17282/m.43008 type:complete len:363 (-) Transcript_17282:215-1303(-)
MVAGNLRDQRAPRDAPLGLRTARRRRDRAAVHRPGRGLDARDHPRPPPQHRARPRRPGLLRAQAQFPRVHRAHRRRGRGQVAPVRAPAPGRPGARGQGGGPGRGQAGAQRQQRVVGARRPCRDRRHRGSRRHAGRQRLQGAERRQWRLDQLLQEVRARYRDQVPRARGAADQQPPRLQAVRRGARRPPPRDAHAVQVCAHARPGPGRLRPEGARQGVRGVRERAVRAGALRDGPPLPGGARRRALRPLPRAQGAVRGARPALRRQAGVRGGVRLHHAGRGLRRVLAGGQVRREGGPDRYRAVQRDENGRGHRGPAVEEPQEPRVLPQAALQRRARLPAAYGGGPLQVQAVVRLCARGGRVAS